MSEEEKKAYEITRVEETGCCPYCGQLRIVEVIDNPDPARRKADADLEAMVSCNCNQGKVHRQRLKVLSEMETNIEDMFGEKEPELARLLQDAKGIIFDGQIDKVSVTDSVGGVASLRMTGGGLKLEYRKTSKAELTAAI